MLSSSEVYVFKTIKLIKFKHALIIGILLHEWWKAIIQSLKTQVLLVIF